MIKKEQYHYLRNLDDFKYFPIDQFDQLAGRMKFRKAPKDHILFFEGDERNRLFLISKGYVKIEQYDSSGTFLYTDYVRNDTIFPYGGIFLDDDYHFSAKAVTNVEYFSLPMELYEEYSFKNPVQMRQLCRKLSRLLQLHEIRLRNMVTSSAQSRVIQSLAVLLFEICPEDAKLPFSLTTIDIAHMSGTTRETVSHTMKQLKMDGVISFKHRTLVYLDTDYFLKYLS